MSNNDTSIDKLVTPKGKNTQGNAVHNVEVPRAEPFEILYPLMENASKLTIDKAMMEGLKDANNEKGKIVQQRYSSELPPTDKAMLGDVA